MWHCVVVMKVLFGFMGLTCVLASGLIPAYSIRGEALGNWTGPAIGGVHCEVGVWRTKCSWWIDQPDTPHASGTSDMKTYDVPLLQREWVVPAMEVTYATVLVLGIATMVWQLAAAREGACLQAKAHGWHYCEWALHIFTTLLGVAYPVFVSLYGTNFWVVYTNDDGWQLNVTTDNDGESNLYVKPGIVVACAGAFFLVVTLLLRYIEVRLQRSAPLAPVTGIPEEIQPVVGQAVNTAAYHTCA